MNTRRRALRIGVGAAVSRWALWGDTPRQRSFDVSYEVRLPGSPDAELAVWLPVPQSDADQSIERLRFDSPGRYEVSSAADGNHCLFTRAAGGSRLAMTFRATRRERRADLLSSQPSPAPDCCLGSDRLVPLDAQIREWAGEVVRRAGARTDVEKARAIYEHVVDTVKYDKSGKGWGRGDIYYACDARRGNCSDFHAIFIGYARAAGVPAKFVIGLPLPTGRGRGEIAGYHCWAEFFAAGHGWIPVDASEAAKDPARRRYFFGALDENRVEFSKGRDVLLAPRQQGEPLNFFVYPYAERGGQPVEGIATSVHFRDAS